MGHDHVSRGNFWKDANIIKKESVYCKKQRVQAGGGIVAGAGGESRGGSS